MNFCAPILYLDDSMIHVSVFTNKWVLKLGVAPKFFRAEKSVFSRRPKIILVLFGVLRFLGLKRPLCTKRPKNSFGQIKVKNASFCTCLKGTS